MVGGHPIPVNHESTFLGHAVHLQWRMHDRIARETPNLGEIVAFRNVVPSIPSDTAVDEISIQALVEQLGYRLVYEPQAIVYNRGPTTVRDFLLQRRRIYAGHLRVADQQGYPAPTMSSARLLRTLLRSGAFMSPRGAVWSMGTVALEATARGLGHYDVMRRRPQHVWEMCATTKEHVADDGQSLGQAAIAALLGQGKHQVGPDQQVLGLVSDQARGKIDDFLPLDVGLAIHRFQLGDFRGKLFEFRLVTG